eukprot:TRINITY_DN2115_c0_g1_i12.p1 TRINITY_DN2115_c0_g1~~TRINITY_DN2115_c0_g1_i12.p1  ORF type:complete len:277 (+),score=93.29 TRINITY_DN2115_c0_g1_i12:50-880(+)
MEKRSITQEEPRSLLSVQKNRGSSRMRENGEPLYKIPKDTGQFRSQYIERQWMKKHGMKDFIDFDDNERQNLHKYFNSLDGDGSGSIGVDELEDPLIALGLVQTREDVEKLVKLVDEDGSGQIEFDEFLSIMSTIKNNSELKASPIFSFFKRMIDGEQLMDRMDKNIPFKLNVSQFRRKRIMDAIMSSSKEDKDSGMKILQAFKKQLYTTKQKEKIQRGENPNDISLEEPPNREDANTRTGFEIKGKKRNADKSVGRAKLLKPKSLAVKSTDAIKR